MELSHYYILFSIGSIAVALLCLALATVARDYRFVKHISAAAAVVLLFLPSICWSLGGSRVMPRNGTGLWTLTLLLSLVVGFLWLRRLYKGRF